MYLRFWQALKSLVEIWANIRYRLEPNRAFRQLAGGNMGQHFFCCIFGYYGACKMQRCVRFSRFLSARRRGRLSHINRPALQLSFVFTVRACSEITGLRPRETIESKRDPSISVERRRTGQIERWYKRGRCETRWEEEKN